MSFLDNISDFYHWMAQFDEVNGRSRTNYISWLKFLSNNYVIDEGISDESINEIISSESGLLTSRPIYKYEKIWSISSRHYESTRNSWIQIM